MSRTQLYKVALLTMLLLSLFTGCAGGKRTDTSLSGSANRDSKEGTKETITAMIKNIDVTTSKLTLVNVTDDKELILAYQNDMEMYDRYGSARVFSQFAKGEIVDITYMNDVITMMQVSKDSWESTEITGLVLNQVEKYAQVLGSKYLYTDQLMVLHNDQLMNANEVCNQDVVTARGYKGKLYSITVDKGHGYVSLVNYSEYIGGMVEVGYDVIVPVADNLLMTVGVGEYTLQVDKNGKVGIKSIIVEENKETVVDLSDVEVIAIKKGWVFFKTNPENVVISIDGNDYDDVDKIKVDYGKHAIEISAIGFKTFNGTITVDGPNLTVYGNLAELDSKEHSSASSEEGTPTTEAPTTEEATTQQDTQVTQTTTQEVTTTTAANATTQEAATTESQTVATTEAGTTTANKVYIEGPAGASVYVDSVYKGTAPTNFNKVTGSHIITLTRDGYVPKVYTITLIDDGVDSYFTFASLASNE